MQKLIQKLIKIEQKLKELQEERVALKKQLLETMQLDKYTVDTGKLRVSVFKVNRLKVKDTRALPAEYKTIIKFERPDLKKIKANLDKVKGLVEQVTDIQVKITERKDE